MSETKILGHEPDTCLAGSPMSEYTLGPGVVGYAIQVGEEIYIPMMDSLKRGNGDVGRFLDSLSRRCVVVNVCNAKLAAMLKRRGWQCKWKAAEECDGKMIDHWRRS
jgi:hypothetical protein